MARSKFVRFESLDIVVIALFAILMASQAEAPNAGGVSITRFSAAGKATFANGTPVVSKNIQYQLILDGAHLFEAGVAGCTQTPSHVAGTVIDNMTSGAQGEYALATPIESLHAAVVRACTLQQLSSNQVEGLRLKASVLADPDTCQTYCTAAADTSRKCVSDCATGNRTLNASIALSSDQFSALAQNSQTGVIQWDSNLVFSDLGPVLSPGPGPDLQVDANAAQNSSRIVQESFAEGACEITEACVRAAGQRKLLRFDGTIQNLGSSDLVIGSPKNNSLFDFSSCHKVDLLKNIMLYELIDPSTNAVVQVKGQEIIGRKQGFCMMDISQINATSSQGDYDCNNQGITAGWEDVYDSALDCQFLDITDVPPGDYLLRLTVNPDGLFRESDSDNNSSEVPITIP